MDEHGMSNTDVAAKLEAGRAYVSLLFNPVKYFGEKAARSIESKLLMPTGYLDSDPDAAPGAVEEWEDPADLPAGMFALVPRISIALAAGTGSFIDVEESLPPLAFRKEWLASRMVTSKSALRIVDVKGDSMAPYLLSGDIVMVDTGQTVITEGQVYAIEHGGEVRVKRLSKTFDGGLIIRSDAPGYPEEVLTPKQAKTLRCTGRVIWRAG
jgi:phage repressor protein C with HTH and peptisase S24 domain